MKVNIKYRKDEYVEFEIDEQDLHLLIGRSYRAAKRGKKFYLYNLDDKYYFHRKVMGDPEDMWIDHIDNNSLNNKRENLRVTTPHQNSFNKSKQSNTSSKFKGVSYYVKLKKYRAYISHKGKRINLGYYVNEIDAAKAYNTKAIELFGEYANLNPIPE